MTSIDQAVQAKFAPLGVALRSLDIAADAELRALNASFNRQKRESHPDDSPTPVEDTIQSLRNMPEFVEIHPWAVWQDNAIVAHAAALLIHMATNQHLIQLEMYVAPEFRRRGIATELMRLVTAVAAARNRTLLVTATESAIPAGEAFMTHLGAKMGLAETVSQLELDALDRDLLRQWQERASERAAGIELGLWAGTYPEAEIAAFAHLRRTMNTAPRDDLDVEDFEWTPEHVRAFEAREAARGVERWTMYVRDGESGELAGFTEVHWKPSEPEMLQQGATAVVPKYRGRGLGRWLKAAMLEKVLTDRPQVKVVRTDNAQSNDPMLKINNELGFQAIQAGKAWQIEIAQLQAHLENHTA